MRRRSSISASAPTGRRWAVRPPIGTFITTVRDFVLMGKIGSDAAARAVVAASTMPRSWGVDRSATQADFQDLPDGGNVTGLVGGEIGLIFQETSVRRMTYEGPPIVFRIDKIANDIGASVPGSVAGLLDMAFFLHKSGFYMVRAARRSRRSAAARSTAPSGRSSTRPTSSAARRRSTRCAGSMSSPIRPTAATARPTAC